MSSHPHSDDGSSLAGAKAMPTETAPSRAGEPGRHGAGRTGQQRKGRCWQRP